MSVHETFPFRGTYIVSATILIVILAVGVVWWSQVRKTEELREVAVQQCAIDMQRRDAIADARTALSNGDDRPIFVQHNGIVLTIRADGIQNCEANLAVPDIRFSDFDPALRTDEEFPVCCDRDPTPNECGQAQDEWLQAYNAELARLKPDILAKYCAEASETG